MARRRSAPQGFRRVKSLGLARDAQLVERVPDPFDPARTMAQVIPLDENPNTAKRKHGHGDGFAIEAQCRDARRDYFPLTVSKPGRDSLGRKRSNMARHGYVI